MKKHSQFKRTLTTHTHTQREWNSSRIGLADGRVHEYESICVSPQTNLHLPTLTQTYIDTILCWHITRLKSDHFSITSNYLLFQTGIDVTYIRVLSSIVIPRAHNARRPLPLTPPTLSEVTSHYVRFIDAIVYHCRLLSARCPHCPYPGDPAKSRWLCRSPQWTTKATATTTFVHHL